MLPLSFCFAFKEFVFDTGVVVFVVVAFGAVFAAVFPLEILSAACFSTEVFLPSFSGLFTGSGAGEEGPPDSDDLEADTVCCTDTGIAFRESR